MHASTRPLLRRLLTAGLTVGLGLSGLTAVTGCEKDKPAAKPADKKEAPTLRLYAVAGAAGAIEPCGCVKDMLGGVDHAAAWIASQEKAAPHSIVVGAGPMFFADPELKEEGQEQALFKAEAMASSLKDLNLVAWAPGANDWADEGKHFEKLLKATGAKALAGNIQETKSLSNVTVVERAGMKIGIVGVSIPEVQGQKSSLKIDDAAPALKNGAAEAKKKGAQVLVALIAAQRGAALRLIEKEPSFQVAVVGKAFDKGEANDPPFDPEVIGQTLVVQAPNHLQGVSVVDLYVRDNQHQFADGSGLEIVARRTSLERKIKELKQRLERWKAPGSGVKKSDLKDREAQLKKLQGELESLKAPEAPKSGSYFLYDLVEVKESHGKDAQVASRLVAYYKQVNEYNQKAYADLKPTPVGEGQASYVGIEICSNCHIEERTFWDKTSHAKAYRTLEVDHKEFNLDCVSCHVTGYDKPGGSTVTHVDKLQDVQCEVCHGPGSLHAENPSNLELIRRKPPESQCTGCHHPPHVPESWSVSEAWPKIIGPGHGG